MDKIAKAFVAAQTAFGPALKTSANPFFKSKYADLSVVIEAVIDALHTNGIALLQNCHESDNGVIVETIFLHESGEMISCGKLSVPAAKNDPQGYGSALTYARRYSLMAACGVAPEDDDGNAAAKAKQQEKPPAPPQKPASAKSVAKDVFDSIGEEEQKYLISVADRVKALLASDDLLLAVNELKAENLDTDERVAIWSLFDSKQRSAIEKTTKENENGVSK